MDRSYGNVFQSNTSAMSPMSPMSPNTPTSAGGGQYKANVNRQKTKKWVEAKVQNYDGDDWGNEYDEEPEEPPAMPPLRTMGPRSPASPPLTTGQQPPPIPRPFQTPASPEPSPGLRSSSGALPLHIQTQQPPLSRTGPFGTDSPLASRPSSLGSPAPGEHLMSSQTMNIPPSALSGVQAHPHGIISPTTQAQTRISPTPQTTGPMPTRFPPRKSSMSQQDSIDSVNAARQHAAGSRPDSTQKPWVEARPASPGSAKSPNTPAKALPFIRPADIYKRMEEQQEKERQSMDSGRLSADNVGRGRTDSPSRTQPEQERPGRQMNPTADDGADSHRAIERKSEYGIEGLIDSYGTPEPEDFPALPAQAAGFMAPEVAPAQAQPGASNEPNESQPEEDPRRFSTSPKLPDLARMSTFGLDLFAGSSTFLSDAPRMPVVPDGTELVAPAEGGSGTAGLQPLAEENEDPADATAPMEPPIAEPALEVPPSAVPNRSSQSSPPNWNPPSSSHEHLPATTMTEGLSATNAATSHEATAGMTEPIGETTQMRAPIEVASEELSKSGDEDVSRGPSPSGDSQAPTDQTADQGGAAAVADQSGVIPVTEAVESAEDSSPAASIEQLSGIGANTSGALGDVKASDELPSGLTRPDSPNSLPPLQTTSPLSPTTNVVPSQLSSMTDHELSRQPPSQVSPGTQASDFTPATAHSEISPTAPLNPHRGNVAPVDMAPPNLERIDTMSTTTTISPAKESDKLREEIIRSLSPVRRESDGGDLAAGEASRPGGARAVRESSYLPDLYDDYWASSDDSKPETDIPAIAEEEAATSSKSADSSIPVGDEPSIPIIAPPPGAPGADGGTSGAEATPVPDQRPETIRRRFSWEAESERGTVGSESPVEPKSLGVVNVPQGATSPPTQTTPGTGHTSPAAPQDPDHVATGAELGGSSSNVEPDHAAMPQSESALPGQPQSPVSVGSDMHAIPGNDTRRLSLAEEKSHAEASGSPLFPAPALDQHPAAAQPPQPSPPSAAHVTSSRKEPINIISFRQIAGMQTPAERIKLFDETRDQFAGTDQGLQDWITAITTQHPEYAYATSRFSDPIGLAANSGAPNAAPPGSPQAAQQPYYQQYLSASSGNLVGGQGTRPTSNLPAPPHHQHGTSGFGHSGNQVGAKSKVLLMAAGKAGKGLLSKGKSKLRGSGEKDPDETSPPSSPQGQRRWSWGISQTFSGRTSSARAGVAQQQQRASLTGASSLPGHHQQQFHRDPQNLPQQQHPRLTQLSQPSSSSPSAAAKRLSGGYQHHHQPSPLSLPPARSNIPGGAGNASGSLVSRSDSSHTELVSPVSETFSSRPTPAPSEQELADNLRVPPPTSKHPPHPRPLFTASPIIVDEERFDPVVATPRAQPGEPIAPAAPPITHGLDKKDESSIADNRPEDGPPPVEVPLEPSLPGSRAAPAPAPAPEPQSQLLRNQPAPAMAAYTQQNPSLAQPAANLPSQAYQQHQQLPQQQQRGYPMQQPQQGYPMQQRQQGYPMQQPQPHHQQGHPAQQRQQGYPMQHQQGFPAQQQQQGHPAMQQQPQQHQAYRPQQQQQQPQALQTSSESPQRQSSFIGLPPIRRTSTFGVNSVLSSDDGSVQDDAADANSIASAHQQAAAASLAQGGQLPSAAVPQQQVANQMPAGPNQFNAAPAQGSFIPGAHLPNQSPIHSHYYPPHGKQMANAAPAGTPQQQGHAPGQPMPQAQHRGFAGPPAQSQVMVNGGQQQMGQGSQPAQQGMQPPQGALAQNAENQIRMPPAGAWKLEESHLSQPLLPANRHRTSPTSSPDQPFYGFDKETGDPVPQSQQTPDVPAQTTAAPNRLSQVQQPASPIARNSISNPPVSPARSSTHGKPAPGTGPSDLPAPGTIPAADDDRPRRNSGIFSSIRDRLSLQSTEGRRSSVGGSRLQDLSQPGAIAPDAASESSVATEEIRESENRRSLLGLRGSAQPSGAAPDHTLAQSRDSVVAHSPPTPTNQRMQPWAPPQQIAPPEKKRTFFGGGGASSAAPPSNLGGSEISRASTATSVTAGQGAPAANPAGPPKKRFSGFPRFGRNSNQDQDQGQKPPGSSHSARPSIQGQQAHPPFAPAQQPGMVAGQERPSSVSSRPITSGAPDQGAPPQAGAVAEEERGRKPGKFLSGIFGNRSGSKPRDPKQQPQQQQQAVGRPAMQPPAGQQGQQPQATQFAGQQNQYQQQYRMQQPQGQQAGARPMAPGQYRPYAGQQQMGQTQYAPREGPPGQQFVPLQGQIPGQRPTMASQHSYHSITQQQQPGVPAGQQPMNRMSGQPAMGPQGQFQSFAQRPGAAAGQQQFNRVPVPSGMNPQGRPQSFVRQPVPAQAQQQPGQPATQGSVAQGQLPSQAAAQQGGQRPAQETQQATGNRSNQHPLQSNGLVQTSDAAGRKDGGEVDASQYSPPAQTPATLDEQPRPQSASPVSLKHPGPVQTVQIAPPQRLEQQTSTPTPPPQSPAQNSIQLSPQRSDALLSQASGEQGADAVSAAPHSLQNSIQSSPVMDPVSDQVQGATGQGVAQQGTNPPSQTTMMQPPALNLSSQASSSSASPAPQPGLQGPPAGSTAQPPNQGPAPLTGVSPAQQPIRLVGAQQGAQGAGTAPPGQLAALPPVPWDQPRASTNSSGPLPPPGQQNMGGQHGVGGPPQQANTMNNGPAKAQQSTMSKFFKSKPAGQTAPAQPAQAKPEKEKKSSLFGLRRSKQPEAKQPPPLQGGPQYRPGQPQQMTQQIPPQAQQPQGQGQPPQGQGQQPQGQGQQPQGQGQWQQARPGPHAQYQHQRQPIANTGAPLPNQGPLAQRPALQQAPTFAQAPAPGQPQQPQQQQPNQAATSQPWQTSGQFRPSQPVPTAAPGQGIPQNQPQPANQWSGAQQYGHVPIPRGYGMVHSEGRVDPAPVAYFVGPDGQYQRVQTGPQGQQQQHQPWMRQVSAGPPPAQQRPDGASVSPPAARAVSQPQPSPHPSNNLTAAPASVSPPAAQVGQGQLVEPQPPVHSQAAPQMRETPLEQDSPAEAEHQITDDVPKPLALATKAQTNATTSVPLPQSKFQSPAAADQENIDSRHPSVLTPGSPQSYPLPDSAFSPVNSAAVNLPNPPLPQGLAPASLGQDTNTNAVQEHRVSAASHDPSILAVSSPSVHNAVSPASGAINGTGVSLGGHSPSPSPQIITPERNVSPEPAQALQPNSIISQSRQTVSPDLSTASTPPPNMSISVPLANQASEENIYDATPRSIPPTRESLVVAADETAEPKAAGPSHEVVDSSKPEPIVVETAVPAAEPLQHETVPAAPGSAPGSGTSNNNSEGTTPSPSPPPAQPEAKQSAAATDNTFEAARRKTSPPAVPLEQEEKIPVFPTEPDMSAAAAAEAERRTQEEDLPQMSATSYPGQEWNPYEHWADEGEDD